MRERAQLFFPTIAFALSTSLAVLASLVVAQDNCNCPGGGGSCTLNCSSVASCCGSGNFGSSCLTPGNQCCLWMQGATQCTLAESCCGSGGSDAFCCAPDTTCCVAASEDGSSTCCGPSQQCCDGSSGFCCDAELEVCGPFDSGICLPKYPITRNPHATPGALLWAANLSITGFVHSPLRVNESFVAVSGGAGTALVSLADGTATFILPQSIVSPAVAGGQVVVATDDQLVAYDLGKRNQSWNAAFNNNFVGLVGYENYLLATGQSSLSVFDARNGSLRYVIPFTSSPARPVVSRFGTVAFAYELAFLVFRLDSGKVLVNATTSCYSSPPPLLSDSLFVSCNLSAYHAGSGQLVWAAATQVQGWSMVATPKTIAASAQGGPAIYIVTKASGHLVTTIEYSTDALAVAGESVLALEMNITAFNGTTGGRLWETSNANYTFWGWNPGVEHRGFVYLPASSESFPVSLVAVNSTTGAISRSWGAGAYASTPLFVGTRMLFMAGDGFLYCVNEL